MFGSLPEVLGELVKKCHCENRVHLAEVLGYVCYGGVTLDMLKDTQRYVKGHLYTFLEFQQWNTILRNLIMYLKEWETSDAQDFERWVYPHGPVVGRDSLRRFNMWAMDIAGGAGCRTYVAVSYLESLYDALMEAREHQ